VQFGAAGCRPCSCASKAVSARRGCRVAGRWTVDFQIAPIDVVRCPTASVTQRHRDPWEATRRSPRDRVANRGCGVPSGSSKPVRCGSPTLGRFDSGAAPLSRLRLPTRARGIGRRRAGRGGCFRWRLLRAALQAGELWRDCGETQIGTELLARAACEMQSLRFEVPPSRRPAPAPARRRARSHLWPQLPPDARAVV